MEKCGLTQRDFALLCKLSGWTAATWNGWKTKEEMNREISGVSLGVSPNRDIDGVSPNREFDGVDPNRDISGVSPKCTDSKEDQAETSSTAKNIEDKNRQTSQLEGKTTKDKEITGSNDLEEHQRQEQSFSR